MRVADRQCGRQLARGRGALVLGATPLLATAPLLLARMRRDFDRAGRLRHSTAAWMWSSYAGYAALTTAALTAAPTGRPLPRPLRAAALALAGAGGLLDLAGIRRFAGPGQLTGTAAGNLVTGGVYRYTRHPQYVGLVASLAGLALARRSPAALALTAGLAAVYRAWVPVEEDHLTRLFGEPYRRYRAATSRRLGRPAPRRSGADRQSPPDGEG